MLSSPHVTARLTSRVFRTPPASRGDSVISRRRHGRRHDPALLSVSWSVAARRHSVRDRESRGETTLSIYRHAPSDAAPPGELERGETPRVKPPGHRASGSVCVSGLQSTQDWIQ